MTERLSADEDEYEDDPVFCVRCDGDGTMSDRGIQYWQQYGQWQQTEHSGPMRRFRQSCQETNMPMIGKYSQSKYLKGSDFPQPALVTIDRCTEENVAKENEQKRIRCILYFAELEKGLAMNKTNLVRVAKITGSENTDDWPGHKVVIYYDEDVEMGGEIVGGLRVRAPKQVAKQVSKPAISRKEAMDAITGMEDDSVPF